MHSSTKSRLCVFPLLVTLSVRLATAVDPYIMCFGSIPVDEAGWPIQRSPYVYPNLWHGRANQQLCPANSGAQYTLGCICGAPGASPICGVHTGADPLLYFWRNLIPENAAGYSDFGTWCEDSCLCRSATLAKNFQDADPEDQAGESMDPLLATEALMMGDNSDWSYENIDTDSADSTDSDAHSPDTTACSNAACNVGSACSGDECICRVMAAQYVPVPGEVHYFAECTTHPNNTNAQSSTGQHPNVDGTQGGAKPVLTNPLNFAGFSVPRLAKRVDVDFLACPCNGTYVSRSCCDASNGLVWEAEELRLGGLVEEMEL